MDLLKEYSYELPKHLISGTPKEPRDEARLFVYDTNANAIHFDVFKNISKYIATQSLFVVNTSQVVPARMILRKETGGKVEILFLVNELFESDKELKGISDRKLSVGQTLLFPNGEKVLVSRQEEQFFFFTPDFPIRSIFELLKTHGSTPIPKYLSHTELLEPALRTRYQSIFAENPASVAAPTASLHFTERVIHSLEDSGNTFAHIALHVGMGTFAPVRKEQIESNKLHKERYEISEDELHKIYKAKESGHPIIAVGTTVVRALESLKQNNGATSAETDIFIRPPYTFKVVDAMITNFHIPESSLMCLVDAFLKHKNAKRNIKELYTIAIENEFRFYSFGDAMYVF